MLKFIGLFILGMTLGFQGAFANEFQKCRAEFKSQSGQVVVSKDICPSQKVQRKISSVDLAAGKCGKTPSLYESCVISNQNINHIEKTSSEGQYSLKVLTVGIP